MRRRVFDRKAAHVLSRWLEQIEHEWVVREERGEVDTVIRVIHDYKNREWFWGAGPRAEVLDWLEASRLAAHQANKATIRKAADEVRQGPAPDAPITIVIATENGVVIRHHALP